MYRGTGKSDRADLRLSALSGRLDAVLPVLIYRVPADRIRHDSVLSDSVNLELISGYTVEQMAASGLESSKDRLEPAAALMDAEAFDRSLRERILWLFHPQREELVCYRDAPELLLLRRCAGWFEAYIPADSAPIPYYWEEELTEPADPEPADSAERWCGSPELYSVWEELAESVALWSRTEGWIHPAESLESLFFSSDKGRGTAEESVGKLGMMPLRAAGAVSRCAADWLSLAERDLQLLRNSSRKGEKVLLLSRTFWSLFAYWVAAGLKPEPVLRKIRKYLGLERKSQKKLSGSGNPVSEF